MFLASATRPRWLKARAVRSRVNHKSSTSGSSARSLAAGAALLALSLLSVSCGAPRSTPLSVVGVPGDAPGSRLPFVAPISASAFADSVGINIHTTYLDTNYRSANDVLADLKDLGVRHVRDTLALNRPDQQQQIESLAQTGIKADLILQAVSGQDQSRLLAQYFDLLAKTYRDALDSIEPPNEADCSLGTDWKSILEPMLERMRALQVNVLPTLPLLGPAFCKPESVATFGALTGVSDTANLHDYPFGHAPELTTESSVAAVRAVTGLQRVTVSETGYHNAQNAQGVQPAVSEQAAADYLLRVLLDDARLGVSRTYLYELLDEQADPQNANQEDHFGLVAADGRKKPAYYAIKNLLADLPSKGQGSTNVAALPIRVQGGGSLVRHLLVQAEDGSYTVALWLATPSNGSSVTGQPTARVRLQFGQEWSFDSQQPGLDNTATTLGKGDAVDVAVSGSPLLLHLRPVKAGGASLGHVPLDSLSNYSSLEQQDGRVLPAAETWPSAVRLSAEAPPGLKSAVAIDHAGALGTVRFPEVFTHWTVELWADTSPNSAQFATFIQLLGVAGGSIRTYDLVNTPTTHVQFSAYGVSAGEAAPGEIWAQALPGRWHYFALSNDGKRVIFYIDGIAVGSAAGADVPFSTLQVGAVTGTWRGSVAGLGLYPRALPAAAILRHATADAFSCPCP